MYGFAQHQSNFFNNIFTDCAPSCQNFGPSSAAVTGGLIEEYISDRFKVTFLVDADCRPARIALRRWLDQRNPAGSRGECDRPALWRCDPGSASELGVSRLLRRLLSSASALDCDRSIDQFGHQPDPGFRPAEGRARSKNTNSAFRFLFTAGCSTKIPSRPARKNWLDHSNIGESNIFWPITWDWRVDSRVGNHTAFPAHLAPRSGPLSVLEPNRTSRGAFHRGLGLPGTRDAGCRVVPTSYAPVDHDQRNTLNMGFNASLPGQTFASTNVYYGSGFTNGNPGRAISRKLSAPAHDLRHFARKEFWREGEIPPLLDCFECGESPRVARQQLDLWRISL